MKPKFFGRYLIEEGCITEEQLIQAIAYQQKAVKRLGEIAVTYNFMTRDQVDKVILEQRKTDGLFGELAVSMGFLTNEQLEKAIAIQKHDHIYLGQALVRNKILSQEKLDKHLHLFQQEQKSFCAIENVVSEKTDHRDEVMVLLDICVKTFRRMANMHLKVGTGYYQGTAVENLSLISAIGFTGNLDLQFFLNMPTHVSVALTRQCYENDEMACDDETVADCIGELTNVICGNASSHLFKMGYSLRIHPPMRMLRSATPTWNVSPGKKLLIFPASVPLPEGAIDIGICFNGEE